MVLQGETYFQALEPYPFVSTGAPFAEACKHHATETFGASRIYIIVSKSISTTENFATLRGALGKRVVGVRYGIRQHVPWPDVLEAARDLRDLDADLIVTLGAGSLTDGAKVAALAAANDAFTLEALESLRGQAEPKPCTVPTINIPTTLSAGEYNPVGGATDLRNHRKAAFKHPSMVAHLVILDPALTVSTPELVWLSSGMRAVDHCVEGLCAPSFRPGEGGQIDKAKVERNLMDGLAQLLPSLLATKQRPGDLEARRTAMGGALDAMRGVLQGVEVGASHGIGHQLGPLGVGHGETSCVMLPSVLRWNREHGDAWVAERQQKVLDAFWGDAAVADALKRHGLSEATATAGDAVGAFVEELGMPTSLVSVGVGRDMLDKLAENSMTDRNIKSNPVRITDAEQIKQILELALGEP
jgi:alcohol dehydrogenase class IV